MRLLLVEMKKAPALLPGPARITRLDRLLFLFLSNVKVHGTLIIPRMCKEGERETREAAFAKMKEVLVWHGSSPYAKRTGVSTY
jgi:hypothetical protein